MRAGHAAAGAVAIFCAAGCSLLVSEDFAADDSPPPGSDAGNDTSSTPTDSGGSTDGSNVATDSGADGTTDAGTDAKLDPSLVAFWTFDGPPATVIEDVTGHGHALVLTAAQVDTTAGKRGGALKCAGAGSVGVASTLEGMAFPSTGSLSLWFEPTFGDTEATSDRLLFDTWDSTRAHLFLRHVGGDPKTSFQAALQPKDTAYAWAKGFFAAPSTYVHVILTWNKASSIAALYVDGVLQKAAAYDFPFEPTAQKFRIGDGFIGFIDEVALYDRALPEAEALLLP